MKYDQMKEIKEIAEKKNLRIGQLIFNATDGKDIFYLSDDQLYKIIKSYNP